MQQLFLFSFLVLIGMVSIPAIRAACSTVEMAALDHLFASTSGPHWSQHVDGTLPMTSVCGTMLPVGKGIPF